jgi:FKBP-type peptidyl-prolyl cis-trans isomerase FkpA
MIVLSCAAGCDDADVGGKKAPPPSAPLSTAAPKSASSDAAGDQSESKKEDPDGEMAKVPFPKLPNGAGEIDADAPHEFTKTDSGLKYRILRKSDGRKPVADDEVLADYKGWFDNGKQFDSSYERGEPLPFQVKTGPGGVIAGWVEGVQLIGVGGMVELEVPPELGYGPQGHPAGIPPNARLHFLVELKEIK